MNENLYFSTVINEQLLRQVGESGYVVFSDLDGTLFPAKKYRQSGNYPELLRATKDVIANLRVLNIPLVPVTGRSLNDLNKTLDFHGINTPDGSPFPIHIYSSGKNIQYQNSSNDWHEDFRYDAIVKSQREQIIGKLGPFYVDLEQLLKAANIETVHFIPRDQQPCDEPFKTYIFEGNTEIVDFIAETANHLMRKYGLEEVRQSTSEVAEITEDRSKFAHSFLPFDKADAINYVLDQLNDLSLPRRIQGITIGNSGNDFSMLMESGEFGCVVGESTGELLAKLKKYPYILESYYTEYITTYGHRNIYHGKGIGPNTILEILEIIVNQ